MALLQITLSLDSVPVYFCYKCLSQFGQFESCLPDSYQQRGELAASGTNSKKQTEAAEQVAKGIILAEASSPDAGMLLPSPSKADLSPHMAVGCEGPMGFIKLICSPLNKFHS